MSPPAAPVRTILATAAVASALVLGMASASAQEADRGAANGPARGWLGVGLQETLVCPGGGDEVPPGAVNPEDCRRAFVAEAVIEDGPADEAGVRPGDTLVALNGRPLASPRGARALRSLRPGRDVELLVGRDDGRTSLRVEPERRPPEAGRLTLHTPLAPAAGTVSVSPGVVLRWSRALGGVEAPEELVRRMSRAALRVDRQGRVYLQGEGEELVRLQGVEADRIRALRDSVMREVRERIRALRRQRAAAGTAGPDRSHPPGAPTLRAAGAEFRPLSPGLAEHVEGVEEGLLVLRVVPGTPADDLGLRRGDVVVEAAGRPTVRPGHLRAAFGRFAEADSIVVRWVREGETASGTLRRP